MHCRLPVVVVALLLVFCGRAWGAGETVVRFAIVIGNNSAPVGLENADLRYADDDAVQTHQLLADAGVESRLLVTLDATTRQLYPRLKPDGGPRLADIERVFAELSERIENAMRGGATTELLFFYSGHGGVEGGEGYIVMEGEPLTRTKLYGLLARSRATHNHVVVDACKSFFLAFDKGPGGTRRPYGGFAAADVPARLGNTGFVLSTSSDRESHEWERYQGGILSHEVRSALRGAADVNLDGRVTYAELGAFLTTANSSIPNPRFRPDFMVRPPEQDLEQVFLRWSEAGAVRLEGTDLGHVYFESSQGERLLDAHAAQGQPLQLHVPRGRPLFVRRHDETAERVVTRANVESISALSPYRPEIARRGAVDLAFDKLFALPFGAHEVSSFTHAPLQPVSPSSAPATPLSIAHVVSGSIALVAVGAGLTLAGIAMSVYGDGARESEIDASRRNERVTNLGIASALCFVGAGTAGVVFWQTGLHPTVGIASVAGSRAPVLAVGLHAQF